MAQFMMKHLLSSSSNDRCTLLEELLNDDKNKDIVLCSEDKCVSVHSSLLSASSKMMRGLLTLTESNLLILPGFANILFDFVTLIYTGKATGLTEQDSILLTSLCGELGMYTSIMNNDGNDSLNKEKSKQNHLKVETEIECEKSDEKYFLRMPVSRIDHSRKTLNLTHMFNGFNGRVQKDYNDSPVGPFEGPFDQDPGVPLAAQLPKNNLSYAKYTNFTHLENLSCKIFKITSDQENCEDLDRINTLEIKEDSKNKFIDPDDTRNIFYTCKKKYCVIPCPCHRCCSDRDQCAEHQICHPDLFDEADHLFSVRSTELGCTEEDFFKFSYVLKYPGIPSTCHQCKLDLLDHKSYHLKFHWTCKFCKLYQYKLYPKSIKALREREIQEQKWYKCVCPYCDTKFVEQHQKEMHVELEHKNTNKKLKCGECAKTFQCQKSLDYHKLSKHTANAPRHHCCDICDKTFLAKVTLDNHKKYKHSDERKFECTKCNSKFKQKKHLYEHSRNVHDSNPRKEDYWQDVKSKIFQCENCTENFTRKNDLKAHMKIRHSIQSIFKCDQCNNSYRYQKNLHQHKLEKHGPELKRYACPDCGKVFSQKRSMERHRLSHVKAN